MIRLACFLLIAGLLPSFTAAEPLASKTIDQGIAYLYTTQNDDGSWSPQVGPAITGLALNALLDHPNIDATDPAAAKAIGYILERVQPDGSIREGEDGILANYNTAICVSALSRLPDNPAAAAAVQGGIAFLSGLQWQPGMTDPQGNAIDENHPFFGGAGYGRHGRPDMSNTQFMIQAMHDAGVEYDDPALRRAVAFLEKAHNRPANDFYPEGALNQDGGFIYSTSINKDLIGVPESKANPEEMDEALEGQPVSGLRSYGSMTYAGFKSYIFANLDRDDPRVQTALAWLKDHYTLDQNPGMPEPIHMQGLYYYYLAHARALEAWGEKSMLINDPKAALVRAYRDRPFETVVEKLNKLKEEGYEQIAIVNSDDDELTVLRGQRQVNWAINLIQKLNTLQQPDGSWVNEADRWMEGDPNLVTAYALLALQAAERSSRSR